MAAQIAFVLMAGLAFGIFIWRVLQIRRNILLGKDVDLTDRPAERWKKMAMIALGQKKMFKRPTAAFLHLAVYLGFIIINIEILEIVLDGIFGSHRMFAPYMGNVYPAFIGIFEFLAVCVIIACVAFLARRYAIQLKRFWAYEMTKWPRTDATIILVTEIVIMSLFLTMNAADAELQNRDYEGYVSTGAFWFSGFLVPLIDGMSTSGLVFLERFAWWAHIAGIFGFLVYIPFSKHFHIFIGFPNVYYSSLEPKGKIRNMPAITEEVKLAMNPDAAFSGDAAPPAEPGSFGAKDVNDLSWKNLMDAYSCTECGRCTAVCPANITGKILSPRKIMMDTRDRVDEMGRYLGRKDAKAKEDPAAAEQQEKTLLHGYISSEEILACTNCQACVEACPVSIDPLSIITELRRYMIMEEAKSPNEWNIMFGNVENNGAPWAFPQSDRLKWKDE